jgi:predicted TIM-barrel fold metal-dependent hydrolase
MTDSSRGAYRVDTHHHILPPAYVAEERERILASAGMVGPSFLDWSPQRALEEMDKNDVATAIVSISTPGVWFGDREQGRRLARLCNEYGAAMARDHRGRFGMFAALPLPDIEGSLREIGYALDVLDLDGFGLMTNYGERYPGDPAFAPVLAELNRRKAAVHVHPTAPVCCPAIADVAPALFEYPTDTTRCIVSLLFSGSLSRFPEIRWIFSHGGGTLPMLTTRIAGSVARPSMKRVSDRIPNGVTHELTRLHFDTASIANPIVMAALKQFVPMTQILFGSDFPFWPIAWVGDPLRRLGLAPEELAAIERGNALRLFPNCRN